MRRITRERERERERRGGERAICSDYSIKNDQVEMTRVLFIC